jgi:hypothetical protein
MISIALIACSPSTHAQVPKAAAESGRLEEKPAPDISIGVRNCDKFLEMYEACLTIAVPEAARPPLAQLLTDTVTAWRSTATTSAGKDRLAAAICKQSPEVTKMKTAMAAYNCHPF